MFDMPMCWKCRDKIAQPDPDDERASTIVGCKGMTEEEWKLGNRKGDQGFIFQHNCPLMKG